MIEMSRRILMLYLTYGTIIEVDGEYYTKIDGEEVKIKEEGGVILCQKK